MIHLPYTWHGAGSPLVLISGLGGKGTSWQPFLGRATEHFRVLSFDLRGSGLAPRLPRGATIRDLAEDVLQLLDKLGVQSAALMGRSMGGMIAQELALLAPERVSSLVLVSTTGRADRHLASIFELWAHMAETRVPLFAASAVAAGGFMDRMSLVSRSLLARLQDRSGGAM